MVLEVNCRCVLVPLGSPTGVPKRVYEQSVPACRTCAGSGVRAGYGTGWCTGGVYRVGNTGGLYRYPATLLEETHGQRSGPRRPCRGRSGWSMGRTYRGRRRDGHSPPCGPGRHPAGTSLGIPSECRLTANRARIHQYFSKVSQKAEVSPKNVEKACHSPCFQNVLEKSPLDFLGFTFSAAFSHKELMGHFDARVGLYCQNDEVSTKCTPPYTTDVTRKGRQIPPRQPADKLLLGCRSSSDSARYSQRLVF